MHNFNLASTNPNRLRTLIYGLGLGGLAYQIVFYLFQIGLGLGLGLDIESLLVV